MRQREKKTRGLTVSSEIILLGNKKLKAGCFDAGEVRHDEIRNGLEDTDSKNHAIDSHGFQSDTGPKLLRAVCFRTPFQISRFTMLLRERKKM